MAKKTIVQQPSRVSRPGREHPLTLTVTVRGQTLSDLETALDRIRSQVAEGYTSGQDRNELGNYKFDREGEEA